MQNKNYGATSDEWVQLSAVLGLTGDLLPVVSNPSAKIDPASTMKGVGKTPSRYNSAGNAVGFAKWTQYTASDADVRRWLAQPDYGICVQTRDVRALDIDVDDPELAKQIHDFILSRYVLPERYRSNAHKHLFAFRLGGDFTKRKFRASSGIVEFLATGQQFIACGTHTSGARYTWRTGGDDGLPDDIPELTAREFEALWTVLVELFAEEGSASQQAASVKQVKLSDAVAADPVAAKLLDANIVKKIERDGRMHITCPWESDHTTDSAESATTYWPAHTGGYEQGHFHCMHAHCEDRSDAEFKAAIGFEDTSALADFEVLADDAPVDREEKPASDMRFAPIQGDAFAQIIETEWIIKGVLPRAELGVVFGESGSGKTFKVLSLAMAVATGHEWRGRAVHQGAVVYVVAEGAGGFRKRLRAHAQHHGVDLAKTPIYVIPSVPNLLEKKDALDVARAILSVGPVSLVVIDTLAQTTAGGNENSGEDMGLALSHCKGIHRATGAMVLLVHHSGKDTSKGARGWSGIRAACDVEMEVMRFESDRVLALTKQKDGDDAIEFGFKLTQVGLGFDSDGEEITSCITEPTDGAPRPAKARSGKKVGHNERLALRAMGELMAGEGEGVRVGDVLEAMCSQMLPPDEGKKDRRREMAHRALQALQDSGTVALNDKGELILTGGE